MRGVAASRPLHECLSKEPLTALVGAKAKAENTPFVQRVRVALPLRLKVAGLPHSAAASLASSGWRLHRRRINPLLAHSPVKKKKKEASVSDVARKESISVLPLAAPRLSVVSKVFQHGSQRRNARSRLTSLNHWADPARRLEPASHPLALCFVRLV